MNFTRHTTAPSPPTLAPRPSDERQELSLDAAASHLLEECRTVVPGMQVLFVALADGDGLRVQLQDVRYRGGVGPLGDRNPV